MPNSAILKASSRSETLIRFIDTTSYHVVELWHWERGMNPPLSAGKLEYDETYNGDQRTTLHSFLMKDMVLVDDLLSLLFPPEFV